MRLKKKKIYKTRTIGFRCTEEEFQKIQMRSLHWTDGNASEFCLYAAMNYSVKKDDIEEEGEEKTSPSQHEQRIAKHG